MSGAGGSEQATLASSRARRGGSGRSYEQETLRGDFRVPWDYQQDCALLGMVRLKRRGAARARSPVLAGGKWRSGGVWRGERAEVAVGSDDWGGGHRARALQVQPSDRWRRWGVCVRAYLSMFGELEGTRLS